jgi:glycine/D-amino acid oxidase-like deaminating enzyme
MPTDPTPWGPTWYTDTMAEAPERPALAQDIDVDACVIGGGLAGLTAGRELARRGWSVAVLEAQRVAWNASGRNAGFVAPGFAERLEAIVERVGLRRAKELWALSVAGVDYVRATIRDTEMPGVDQVAGRLTVRRSDDEEAVLRLVAMMRVDFGVAAEAWPTEQVREVLRTPLYYQAVHMPDAFHVHALNYALGLAAAAERAGARIYENTPAVALDVLGVRKRIDTPDGRIRANHIVLAGGAHLGAVFPPVAGTVVPVASYIVTTAPLGERLAEAIRYPGAVADTRRAGDYYRIIGGDRLMWGGRITTRLSLPRWLGALMRRDIGRVYPQLGDADIEHAWAGVMSYAVHKMPQIGELTPGVWLAGAFGGHGLNTTAMAGDLIARAIVERDDRWRLFSAYELVWAGGRIGPPAAQALYWTMQVRDAIEERLSHRREATRRRAAETAARQAAIVTAERMALTVRDAGEAAAHEIADAPARFDAAEQEYFAPDDGAPRGAVAADYASEEDARHALEAAAARAAQAIAQQVAEARSRAAEAACARARAPGADADAFAAAQGHAPSPEADAMEIGEFSPQLITPAEEAPAVEEPMIAEDIDAAPPATRPGRRPRAED